MRVSLVVDLVVFSFLFEVLNVFFMKISAVCQTCLKRSLLMVPDVPAPTLYLTCLFLLISFVMCLWCGLSGLVFLAFSVLQSLTRNTFPAKPIRLHLHLDLSRYSPSLHVSSALVSSCLLCVALSV